MYYCKSSKIIIPPISSHLKDTKTATSKIIQGKVFGKLCMMPLMPPPKRSAPDNKEKIKSNVLRTNNTVLAQFFISLVVLYLSLIHI